MKHLYCVQVVLPDLAVLRIAVFEGDGQINRSANPAIRWPASRLSSHLITNGS